MLWYSYTCQFYINEVVSIYRIGSENKKGENMSILNCWLLKIF